LRLQRGNLTVSKRNHKFIKNNMARGYDFVTGKLQTAVTFMLTRIPQKGTLRGVWRKLV
jgi:hypothetical protein